MSLSDAALAADVAADAGKLLLAVREEVGFDDPYDLGDAGDMRANVLILDRLKRDRPDDAVLSEEAVDDETLEAVAGLRDQLRGDLGDQLCAHITRREVAALRSRSVALLDNPVMPTPDRRRPIPWPAF